MHKFCIILVLAATTSVNAQVETFTPQPISAVSAPVDTTSLMSPLDYWKALRNDWLGQKKGMLASLRGLPPQEYTRKYLSWLLYQAPPSQVEMQYLRFEDMFMLSMDLNEWPTAQIYLNKMAELSPKIPYGTAILMNWLQQLQYLPAHQLDRTALLETYQTQLEKEGQYKVLAEFFADNANPLRDINKARSYIQKHTSGLPPLRAFEATRKWELQFEQSELATWYQSMQSKEQIKHLVYWWSGQYQYYCQSLGKYAKVNNAGVVEGDNCER